MHLLKVSGLAAWTCCCLFAMNGYAADIVVNPGEKIQDAVKRAVSGDTIRVMPGLYEETVYIDKDDVDLSGVRVDG